MRIYFSVRTDISVCINNNIISKIEFFTKNSMTNLGVLGRRTFVFRRQIYDRLYEIINFNIRSLYSHELEKS